jgi:hypothetical protein
MNEQLELDKKTATQASSSSEPVKLKLCDTVWVRGQKLAISAVVIIFIFIIPKMCFIILRNHTILMTNYFSPHHDL